MYVCMHACMYVTRMCRHEIVRADEDTQPCTACMYACIYVWHTCMYVCVYMHLRISTRLCIRMHGACTYAFMHVYMYVYMSRKCRQELVWVDEDTQPAPHAYVCMYVRTFVCMYVCMYVCEWMKIPNRLHMLYKYTNCSSLNLHALTYIRTYIRTYMYTLRVDRT